MAVKGVLYVSVAMKEFAHKDDGHAFAMAPLLACQFCQVSSHGARRSSFLLVSICLLEKHLLAREVTKWNSGDNELTMSALEQQIQNLVIGFLPNASPPSPL